MICIPTPTDKVRAGILSEFEKSKEQYNSALDHARKESQNKLKERRAIANAKAFGSGGSGSSGRGESDKGDSDKENVSMVRRTQDVLENVVNAFLDDPITLNLGRSAGSNGINKKKHLTGIVKPKFEGNMKNMNNMDNMDTMADQQALKREMEEFKSLKEMGQKKDQVSLIFRYMTSYISILLLSYFTFHAEWCIGKPALVFFSSSLFLSHPIIALP